MALDFPSSPTDGEIYVVGERAWRWNDTKGTWDPAPGYWDGVGPKIVDPDTGEEITPTDTYTRDGVIWAYYEVLATESYRIAAVGTDEVWGDQIEGEVQGAGGGTGRGHGGAGAGGRVRNTFKVYPGMILDAVIGAGGPANSGDTAPGHGSISRLGPLVALGGARGNMYSIQPVGPSDGGCASGSDSSDRCFGLQGFGGGSGAFDVTVNANLGGGGGGVDAAGTNANTGTHTAGSGGDGREIEISDDSTEYGGGGGGGAGPAGPGGTPGSGTDGGGNGAQNGNGNPGGENTGGGAGAPGHSDGGAQNNGAAGGSARAGFRVKIGEEA